MTSYRTTRLSAILAMSMSYITFFHLSGMAAAQSVPSFKLATCGPSLSPDNFKLRKHAEVAAAVAAQRLQPNTLEQAIWVQDRYLASRLLEEGANPNSFSSGNKEPLIVVAAMQGDPLLISMLLAYGAKIDAASKSGTALYWAARQGNLEAARALIACGANARFTAPDGSTPLHMTIGDDNDVRIAEALLNAGADLEARQRGMTPLMQASLFGRTEWVKLFLERGADVNAKTPDGRSSLALARALVNSPEVVKLLVTAGAK